MKLFYLEKDCHLPRNRLLFKSAIKVFSETASCLPVEEMVFRWKLRRITDIEINVSRFTSIRYWSIEAKQQQVQYNLIDRSI